MAEDQSDSYGRALADADPRGLHQHAQTYSVERAAIGVILELATCMGSNLRLPELQVDNQDHMLAVLRWIADHPHPQGQRSLNFDDFSDEEMRQAQQLARRAANAIAEHFGKEQSDAQDRVEAAFDGAFGPED